jgi:hypothetical protein
MPIPWRSGYCINGHIRGVQDFFIRGLGKMTPLTTIKNFLVRKMNIIFGTT